jgi:hypothetical protein
VIRHTTPFPITARAITSMWTTLLICMSSPILDRDLVDIRTLPFGMAGGKGGPDFP